MLKEKVKPYFLERDCNCAETMLHAISDSYGLKLTEDEIHLLSGFGGGCGCGKICGALAASVAGLGRMSVEGRAHVTPGFKENCGALCARFEAALGGTDCTELKPRYFKPDVRCLELLEKATDCFEDFVKENGIARK